MTEGQQIASDYRALGLTLGRHPLELLRPRLLAQRLLPASTLAGFRNGQLARACGIVTVRQRPGTAKGAMFVTLEDETGKVNVIIWPSLLKKQRREALGSSLLAVYGVWQREGEVRHLVAHPAGRRVPAARLARHVDTKLPLRTGVPYSRTFLQGEPPCAIQPRSRRTTASTSGCLART
jgi:DNA polymerase III alpha subunit